MPPATPDDQDPATPGPGPRGPEVLTVSQFNRKDIGNGAPFDGFGKTEI